MVLRGSRYRGPALDAACYRILYEIYPCQVRDCAVPRLTLPEMTFPQPALWARRI